MRLKAVREDLITHLEREMERLHVPEVVSEHSISITRSTLTSIATEAEDHV